MKISSKKNIDIIKTELLKFPFFLKHGFSFLEGNYTDLQTTGTFDKYAYIFINLKAKIKIKIIYKNNLQFKRDCFSVIIENDNGNYFFLSHYITYKQMHFNKDFFNLENYSGNFQQQFLSFLNFLDSIFQTKDLYEILIGKKWEAIPIDWHGYK